MKETFNTKTQDIPLYISPEELEYLLGPWGPEGIRLVNKQKKVFFLLYRSLWVDEEEAGAVSVHSEYNRTVQTTGETGHTDFFIGLSPRACSDLKIHGHCRDRYLGKTGQEMVSVSVGDP